MRRDTSGSTSATIFGTSLVRARRTENPVIRTSYDPMGGRSDGPPARSVGLNDEERMPGGIRSSFVSC